MWGAAGSAITSEMRILAADAPRGDWRVVLPRVSDVEYDISHRGDHLFVLLRDAERQNSELLVAPLADPTATKVHTLHCVPCQPCACKCAWRECLYPVANIVFHGVRTCPLASIMEICCAREWSGAVHKV